MKEFPRDTVKFCDAGYNDACTNFLIDFHNSDFDILDKCIRNVTEYNNFRGARTATAFSKVKHLAYKAQFGREGSPALYIQVKRENRNVDGSLGAPIGVEEIINAFKNLHVDEIGVSEFNPAVIRFWWD